MNTNKVQKSLLYFIPFLLGISIIACKTQNKANHTDEHKYTNHLINESSPYLLQHAHNPVDWHPWGEEALQKAKDEDKMLIISVGYAACHWCHVMEHESFEDTLVAKIMNENFVCIKVDREERPDIDDVYMTACQMSSGRSCGWPLNCFAFADGRPFWAGTYFPKDQWLNVLNSFVKMRKDEPKKLEDAAAQITQGIQGSGRIALQVGEVEFTRENLDGIGKNFLSQVDMKKGGRKGSPKFPMPNNYEFLLKYNHLSGDKDALKSVYATLDNMAFGGIYDQLGGGFARYSTDDRWFAPHFEKMLYDNGQLIGLYSKAYRQSKNPLYQEVVEGSINFIERELTNEIGGFYSSLDADSEGEEGKFYVWTKSEIDSIIGNAELAEIFNDYYEVKKRGNWEQGNNILHRQKSNAEVASKFGITAADLKTKLGEAEAKLFKARGGRVRPGLDDKVLTSWNALMLNGYVEAYKAFGKESYRAAALKNGNFILKEMMDEDFRLDRNYKNGKSTINAFLDDYAQTINAFINLYQITFDEKWLNNAKGLGDYAIVHFFDNESGMFNYTSDTDPALIARKMDLSDNVIPGSNSSMARALLSLGHFLYNKDYLDKAHQMMHNINDQLVNSEQPSFFSNWCQLYLDFVNPPYEVAIMGDDYEVKRNEMMLNYLPNSIFLGGKKEGKLELLQNKLAEGETMIYVCQDKVCKFPVTEAGEALKLVE